MDNRRFSPYLNPEWLSAEKKIDPDFNGSIFQKLGFEPQLCPVCGAHLKKVEDAVTEAYQPNDLICLNACHLVEKSKLDFHQFMLAHVNFEQALVGAMKEAGITDEEIAAMKSEEELEDEDGGDKIGKD